ncbi:hypothetical protein predicted by Glimmer/Critica [Neisseria meningitidis WUE 2594]|nr:hypothetical protein predicted by Glimmer/Critica [Neisseria meningitidis WUE 2594]
MLSVLLLLFAFCFLANCRPLNGSDVWLPACGD